jgi:hypothetical protein
MQLNKWVLLGLALIVVSLMILVPLVLRRQRLKKAEEQQQQKAKGSPDPLAEQKAQFDRLLAAALEQEREFKALKHQHSTLAQKFELLQKAHPLPPPPPNPALRNRGPIIIPSTIVEDELEDELDSYPDDHEFKEEVIHLAHMVEPMIFTSSTTILGAPPPPLTRPSTATVEEVTDDDENQDLDRELERELGTGRAVPEVKDADPVADSEPAVNEEESSPKAPALLTPTTPILVFDGGVAVKPAPKAPTKRTPKPRKPKTSAQP